MNFKLTKIQFFLMLFFIETGVIYISFQQGVIDYGGRDAWIMFGVASIFMYLLLFFYEKNYKFFRLGKITKWIYILYWLVVIISFLSYMQYAIYIKRVDHSKYATILLIIGYCSRYSIYQFK